MTIEELSGYMLVLGVPVGVSICAWGLTEIIRSGKKIERLLTHVESMQEELGKQDSRLNRLEDGYFKS